MNYNTFSHLVVVFSLFLANYINLGRDCDQTVGLKKSIAVKPQVFSTMSESVAYISQSAEC